MTNIIPDFGSSVNGEQLPPIPFMIDGETFYAVPETSMGVLFDMGQLLKVEGLDKQLEALTLFIQSNLLPESFERLKLRMRDPGRPPVTFPQIMRILQYVMEQQAGRPTMPSSPSTEQPPPTGGSSTAGAQPMVSTPVPSL